MRKLLLLIPLVIAACAATTQTPEPVIVTVLVTAIPQPTKTPQPTDTPKPLTYLDLEPLLFQSGDLPSDYAKGVVSDSIQGNRPFSLARSLPEPKTITMLKIDDLAHNSASAVVVLSYESSDDTNDGFAALNTKDFEDLSGVGEKASVETGSSNTLFNWRFLNVVFIRCNMVVYLTTSADTINYAKRLDARLSQAFCP